MGTQRKVRNRGTGNRIYDLLTKTGQPMSLDAIGKELGLTNSEVSGACSYLVDRSHIERVKAGVYRALVSRPADVSIEVRNATVADAATEPVTVRPMSEIAVELEEEVYELLDLLFPQGIRAHHLPLIDKWRQETASMLLAVRSEIVPG